MATTTATDLTSAVNLLVPDTNIIHDIINGDADTDVAVENGYIPTIRKVYADTLYFLSEVEAWTEAEEAVSSQQLYNFGGLLYWAPSATGSNTVPLGTTPVGDSNWQVAPTRWNYLQAVAIVYNTTTDNVALLQTGDIDTDIGVNYFYDADNEVVYYYNGDTITGSITTIGTASGNSLTITMSDAAEYVLTKNEIVSELKSIAIANNTSVNNVAFLYDGVILTEQEYLRVASEEKTYFVAGGVVGTVNSTSVIDDNLLLITYNTSSTSVALSLPFKLNEIKLSSFISYVTDRNSESSDSSTWDWSPALQAASDTIRSLVNAGTIDYGCDILLDVGGMTFNSQVVLSQFCKIVPIGMCKVTTNVLGDAAWRHMPQYDDVTLSGYSKAQWMNKPIIDDSRGWIHFVNGVADNAETYPVSFGQTYAEGTAATNPNTQQYSRYNCNGFSSESYFAGFLINSYNNYIGTFNRVHSELNTNCFVVGGSDNLKANSGEKWSFNDCLFAGGESALYNRVIDCEFNFNNCSIDFCGTAFRDYGGSTINFFGGHIEKIGIDTGLAHDGVGGIYLSEDNGGNAFSRRSKVNIIGPKLVVNPWNLFRSFYHVVVNLDCQISLIAPDNGRILPYNVMSLDNTVVFNKFNLVGYYTPLCQPSRLYNLIDDQYFEEAIVSDTSLATSSWTSSGTNFNMVVIASDDSIYSTGNAIQVSRTTATTGGFFELTNQKNIPVEPGETILASFSVKASDDFNSFTSYIAYSFYDKDDTQLLSQTISLNRGNQVNGSYQNPQQFNTQYLPVAPAKSSYVKIRFGLSNIDEGETVNILAPIAWRVK